MSDELEQNKSRNLDWLSSRSKMSKIINSMDWSKTEIGPIESWPESLRSILSLCLDALSPFGIYWGAKFILFYNDAWRPIVGDKHPQSYGQAGKAVWLEVWDMVEPMFKSVLNGGEAIWKEDQLFPLQRFGYIEECYFNFNLSPIRSSNGSVEGVLNIVIETTYRVVNERRTQFINKLVSQISNTKNAEEVCSFAANVITDNAADIAFSMFYLLDQQKNCAYLVASSHLQTEDSKIQNIIDLSKSNETNDNWSVLEVIKTRKIQKISDSSNWLPILTNSFWPEKPIEAWALPIPSAGDNLIGVFIAGISPRRIFDDSYRSFLNIVCGNIASSINNVRALEEERTRAEALAEIDRAKTVFFSNVSHEFRTPLTLIIGPVEELLHNSYGDLLPTQREQIQVIYRNSLRLLKLVNNLLDFSRVESKRMQAVYETIDLAFATADLASLFRSAVERAGLKLTIDCESLPSSVYVDREMWEKIVFNLISNAFKYTLKGGIQVSLKAVGNFVEFSVSDTGIGISEVELPKVFQRFHRVEGAHGRTHEGTGIGLAMVQELVKLHGGSIFARSTIGQGSLFTVSIPLGNSHLPSDRILEKQKTWTSIEDDTKAFSEEALRWLPGKETSNASIQQKTNKKKIVLADDNADMREYISKLLLEKYEVIVTSNGKEALDAVRENHPDLILSDIMMPIMDGIELLKVLRSDPIFQTTPVILLSARAGEESKIDGVDLGADDYLTKPFSAKELQVRIHTQLSLSSMRTKLLNDLELSNKELDSFSSAVSHDLRAPLRGMAGFSKILLDDYSQFLDEKGIHYLERIVHAAQKMGLLIDGLLNLSRLTRGEKRSQTVDLSEIAQSIISELKSLEPLRQIDVTIEPNITLEGDLIFFQIALQNLLSNAWKFSSKKDKAKIEFGMTERDGKKIYFVRDNGAGFEMQYANKLFGVFQRLHSVNEFDGIGIGLATVQRIIHRHGGTIWAESQVNHGATFYFTI